MYGHSSGPAAGDGLNHQHYYDGGNAPVSYGTRQSSGAGFPGDQEQQARYSAAEAGGSYYHASGGGQYQQSGMGEIALACIHDGYSYDGISAVCFDVGEESIWTGSVHGGVFQHICPSLEYYSSIHGHDRGAVIQMRSLGSSVASLSAGEFSIHASGGASRACYLDTIGDMSGFSYQHWNHRAVIGRHGGGVFIYDVVRGGVSAAFETQHDVVAVSGPMGSGQVALASATGYLTVFDSRKAKISGDGAVAEAQIYSHGFLALESSGNIIATAGYGGIDRPVLEPVVKIFDSRMGIKQLASIPFSNGPAVVKFHPTLRSTLLVCSANGMFSMLDTSGAVSSSTENYFVDMGGDTVSSCDISATGDCIAFGGANGYLHLWSGSTEPMIATGVLPEYATPVDKTLIPYMDENTSFSVAPLHLTPDGDNYASYVGDDEVMSTGLPPRVIDDALLSTGKVSDFVTYIKNPKYDENNPVGKSAAAVALLRNKRTQHRRSGKAIEAAIQERARKREQEGGVILPRKFCRVIIRQQKGTRFEEFDFKMYNKTPFSGLENGLANCYMNPLIQILFFTRPLRDFASTHAPEPEKEFSLLGELSLLFHMLATSDGEVCQASNLLRALRQTSEALALGLLEGVKGERGAVDIVVEAQKDKSLVRRIERLCRFLITRLDREEEDYDGQSSQIIKEIFCMHQRQKMTCLTHKLDPKVQDITTFQLELRYPSSAQGVNFSSILRNSLETSSEIKAWFNESVKYQPVRQERSPTRMPTVLTTYTGLEDTSLLEFWEFTKVGSFPFAISVTMDKEKSCLSVQQAESLVSLNEILEPVPEGAQRDVYLLTGVLAFVYDKDEAEEIGKSYEGHLISHINVPPSYFRGKSVDDSISASSEPSDGLGLKWMTFNDFSISTCSTEEIQRTFDGQKIPILLFFTKASYLQQYNHVELARSAPVLDQATFLDLCNALPIQATQGKRRSLDILPRTFLPFSERDVPKKGDIFALDAEFVAYSAPEKMILNDQDDWSRTSRLGLGRVSLVRGNGPLSGTPCIDDYIRSVEPVYDHLTRYSGLLPGDLDMEHSRRHLTTLRKAYLKLRYLVDLGCIFVGHGLKKDFRMLNIVVPPDQVVDTMDLYYSGRGRRLSLKFLSSFFLQDSIQGDTHDSVEDATAALNLFRMYEKLVSQGCFAEMLQKAYDWGSMYGWDPSSWGSQNPHDVFVTLQDS